MARQASAGHKLGQLIGDWFEEYFVLKLLTEAAKELHLYLDHRFTKRHIRGEKVIWQDDQENEVDYDFVLELGGTDTQLGIPVAFIESCWRRGSRHSKDKARDDSGKLRPMRATYPTARFLGMVVAGDFTTPARELIRNYDIDLFYIPKPIIIQAFNINNLAMDYPDQSAEDEKQHIAIEFETSFSREKKLAVAGSLIELLGKATVNSYISRLEAKLSSLPQEIRFTLQHNFPPIVFESISAATQFIENPTFKTSRPVESYVYQVIYSDGTEFESNVSSLNGLKILHKQITALADHMNRLTQRTT